MAKPNGQVRWPNQMDNPNGQPKCTRQMTAPNDKPNSQAKRPSYKCLLDKPCAKVIICRFKLKLLAFEHMYSRKIF